MSDVADKEWADAYRRGLAASKAGVRPAGAAEADAVLAAASKGQRRFTNEDLERFWAPDEWGTLYEPSRRRRK
jgi:hypothetical protein